MKLVNIILIICFRNTLIAQIDLPESLEFNPLNLPDKTISEIIQYKIEYPKTGSKIDTTISYIFTYHENYYSLKSNFRKEKHMLLSQKERFKYPPGYCCMNDSVNLFWLNSHDSYNYLEKRYYLDKNYNLTDSVQVIEPKRFITYGILDGIYIRESKDTIVKTEKTTVYNNQLLKKEIYFNDSLYSITEYQYETYWSEFLGKKDKYSLLTKITSINYNSLLFKKTETIIEYTIESNIENSTEN